MIDFRRLLPKYWYQLYPTSIEWDRKVNYNLDTYGIEDIDGMYVKTGDLTLWIGNYPTGYAYSPLDFDTYKFDGYKYYLSEEPVMPTIKTRKRLRKMVYEKFNEPFDPKQE